MLDFIMSILFGLAMYLLGSAVTEDTVFQDCIQNHSAQLGSKQIICMKADKDEPTE